MICISKNVVPFFSVIITTYNRKNIVKKAINSVLNQTEQDFELIIVDDGSQDNTYDDLKKYC
jgi:glycosyltransferase involved in cell wall biosynthesis